MRTLNLTEFQPQAAVALSAQTAASLQALGCGVTITPTWNTPGHFDLQPGSHVGVIALPDLVVQIRPKLPVDRVLFLIFYALDPSRWQREQGLYGAADTLVEAMAAVFAYDLHGALRQGVLQGYHPTYDALSTVRGRVRLDEQLRRRYGAPMPLEVVFDEYSVDTDLNRLLTAALHRLSRLPIRSVKVRHALRACAAAFEAVPLVEYRSSSLPDLAWNHLNDRFRRAADMARMILGRSSVELTEGPVRGAAFTIDMNAVFESFARAALREALGLSLTTFPDRPPAFTLDAARNVRLVPDLTWWHGQRCLFVGDVKYKRITFDGFRHADLYQLLAYTVALGLRDGVLVYPAGEGAGGTYDIDGAGIRLHLRSLDVRGSPEEVLHGVRALADDVRTLATRA